MKILIAATTTVLFASGLAQAHAHLTDSDPAEGSIVASAPANLVLKFSEAARLTALSVQQDGAGEQKLSPLPSAAARSITVAAPKLAPGKYAVTWRVVSNDNHIMSGTLHFTIDPAANSSAKTSDRTPAH